LKFFIIFTDCAIVCGGEQWRGVEQKIVEGAEESPPISTPLKIMMKFSTREMMPQAATTIRVTQFVFQMNNFHHPRISLSRVCLEVTFPRASYVTIHVGT
jgi:hypothetical protein